MTTAVRPKSNRKRKPGGELIQLREDRVSGFAPLAAGTPRVDRDKGIIYGVKVLGRTSVNTHKSGANKGTRYTDQAMQACSRRIAEGLEVNTNHMHEGGDRDVNDGLGKLLNPKLTPEGVFADLHCLTTHPMWERVAEAAEKMPDAFALSINAWGKGEIEDGWFVINDLPAASFQSVDLVRNGGTNRSLFESQTGVRSMTLYELCKKHSDLKEKLAGLFRVWESARDMEVAVREDDSSGGDYRDHLHMAKKMCEDAGDMETATKIHKLMKPDQEEEEDTERENKPSEGTEGDGAKGPDSKKAAGGEDEEEPSKQKESRKAKRGEPGTRRLLESTVKSLVQLAGVKEDPRLLRSLQAMGSEQAVIEHLQYLRESTPASRGQRPSSATPGSGTVSATPLKTSDLRKAMCG